MALLPPLNQEPPTLKARRLSKNSDYVKGVMPIEEYLDRVDPYTSSTLKWPRPFEIKPASPELTQEIELHREEILTILDTQSFPPRAYLRLTVQKVTKRGYMSSKPKALLSLAYITNPYSPRAPQPPPKLTMDAARDEVACHLLAKGISDISTEITFTNQAWNPMLFAFPETNALFAPFKHTIQPAIASCILPKYTNAWQKVSIFYVGLTVEENFPTLVITVSPQVKGDWAALNETIRDLLLEKEKRELDIEFWPGALKGVWDPNSEVVDEDDVDNQKVKMEDAQRNQNARRRPVLDRIGHETSELVRGETKDEDDDDDEMVSRLGGFFIIPRPGRPEHERCASPKPLLEEVLAKYARRILG
ncbi:hypothetical protein BDW71DRAFT_207417 [Aspergillus fruticulosus]